MRGVAQVCVGCGNVDIEVVERTGIRVGSQIAFTAEPKLRVTLTIPATAIEEIAVKVSAPAVVPAGK